MTGNSDKGRSWFKLAWPCIAILLSTGSLIAMGQNTDTSVPDRAYCVGTGNLYTTNPGLNNDKAICQFADNSWCDAHEFFIGNCTGATTSPYYYSTPMSALDIADVTKACQVRGGQVQNVHTVYGDVNLCVFPDGSSIDLRSLSSTVYGEVSGTPYIGYYGMPSDVYYMPYSGFYTLPDNTINDANAWYYLAYSWLNAP